MSEDRLARALDDCLDRLRSGTKVEECLAAYPGLREELEPLLVAAATVSAAAVSSLPADRRARHRARLIGALQAPARSSAGAGWRWGRWLLAPAAAIALFAALAFGLGTSQAPDSAEAATILTVLQGDVRVESIGGTVIARDHLQIQPGDRVVTGKGGRAVITFFDGSTITLDGDTTLAIRTISAQKNSARVVVTQSRGSTWTHVPTVLRPSQIEIETPNARVQTREAAFSTTVDANGRTLVGATTGALELSSGGQRAAVSGGQGAAVDSSGALGRVAVVSEPSELVLRVSGSVLPFLTDPGEGVVGIPLPGVLVNQVPGATMARDGDQLVLRVPAPKDGTYLLVLRGIGAGKVTVKADLIPAGGAESMSLTVSAGQIWRIGLTVESGRLSVSPVAAGEPGAMPASVTIPDRVLERAKGVAGDGLPALPVVTATASPTPSRTATPVRTGTVSPTPSATPPRQASPSPSPTGTPTPQSTPEAEESTS